MPDHPSTTPSVRSPIDEGTNRLVGTDPTEIREAALSILAGRRGAPRCPDLWDGRTAERILDVFESWGAARGLHERETATVA